VCRLPRLVVPRLLEGALQIRISLGSTQNAWKETRAAVAAPSQELQDALAHQPVLKWGRNGTPDQRRDTLALDARRHSCSRPLPPRAARMSCNVCSARPFPAFSAHFFTFVHEEGVEPTNNAAERALRTAVQWRKIMFGNRSEEGERAVARFLTVTRTCQLQQLNVLAYLTAAISCYRRRQTVASLLPKRPTP
jgi:hypothetical protein